MKIKYPLGNSALIINKSNNKIVAVHRKEDESLLCLPGGKLENNESSIQGMIREVFEETGITIEETNAIPLYVGICNSNVKYWVTTYLVELDYNIELHSNEIEMKPEWVDINVFLERNAFYEYNKNVIEAYQNLI